MKIVKPIVFRNFDFTRASEATYYDQDGYLVTAPEDVLRLGYNPSTLDFIGPIVEDSGVNYVGETFTDPGSWDFNGVTLGAVPNVLSPAGILETVCSAGDDGSGPMIEQVTTIPTGDVIFSVYAKLIPGQMFAALLLGFDNNVNAVFDVANGSVNLVFGGVTAGVQHLPNSWHRFYVSGSTSTGKVNIGISGGYPLTSLFKSIYLYKPQVENATSDGLPTSYMVEVDPSPAALYYRAADVTVEAPPRVVTSNVDEDDAPVWDAGENYAANDPVMVLGQVHKVYRSIGANINKYPPEHSEEWIDEGSTNRWRMFDMTVGLEKQTVSTNSSNTVEVLLELDQIVTAVALLNMEANNVRIIMRDEFGEIVYEHYEDLLQAPTSSDWWSFFFATRSSIKTLVLTDLPSVKPSTIEMILDGDAFPAKIGKMIVGEAVDIGCARYGTSVGIVDFSRKERDPFGNNFILERRYIDRADYDVQILTANIDNVKALLTSIRAIPALYIGDEQFASTVIYGFYRDFSIVISGPRRSDATIQVESI